MRSKGEKGEKTARKDREQRALNRERGRAKKKEAISTPLPSERLGVGTEADGVEAAVSREGSVEVGRGSDA